MNILNNWYLARSKWSLCSIQNEGKILKGITFQLLYLLVHCVIFLPYSSLVWAGGLTEFEIIISGKIIGNPWESCWSRETMLTVNLLWECTYAVLLSSQLNSKAIEERHQKWDAWQQFSAYLAAKSWRQLYTNVFSYEEAKRILYFTYMTCQMLLS